MEGSFDNFDLCLPRERQDIQDRVKQANHNELVPDSLITTELDLVPEMIEYLHDILQLLEWLGDEPDVLTQRNATIL